ncbi:MAG TPA: hypothetical protein VKR31_08280 [Rhizomicrobium sp.]|nr:hypothetical protein [Rhizomicrobium sp.]
MPELRNVGIDAGEMGGAFFAVSFHIGKLRAERVGLGHESFA